MNDEKKIGFSVELENNHVDLWAHGDDETLVNLAVAATANIVAAACGNDVKEAEKLLHDVCKAGKYIAKPEGGYRYRDTRMLGHGEESVILIQHWMYLTEKETLAIRWHMGVYTGQQDWDTLSKVYDSCPEALCVHMADMIATHIMEVEK